MTRRTSPPVVAIVGRPNTGKSTLFNRLCGHKIAIMDPTPGVTRDLVRHETDLDGVRVLLVDSGGLFNDTDDDLNRLVHERSLRLLEEADVVLLLGEADGLVPADREIARMVHKTGRKDRCVLAVNKADRLPENRRPSEAAEWSALGLGEPLFISASHGQGLDALVRRLAGLAAQVSHTPPPTPEGTAHPEITVCIAGKPNAGKSTLLNRLAGEEIALVHERPGTTRDPVDTVVRYHGRTVRFIDTAGLRKKSRVRGDIEYYSVTRTVKNIRRADITLLVLDAREGLTEQDKKIVGLVREAHKGLVIAVNKWDLVDDPSAFPEYLQALRRHAPWLEHIPVVSVSGLTGLRVSRLPELILRTDENYRRHVETSRLNRLMADLKLSERLKLRYAVQVRTAPPVFQVFVNNERLLDDSRRAAILNTICRELGFEGVFPDLQVKSSRRRDPP